MNLRTGKVLPNLPKPPPRKGSKDSTPPVDPAAQPGKQEEPATCEQDARKIDYNVIAHLKHIPASLSVYDALLLVPDQWHALIKALQTPKVYEVTTAKHCWRLPSHHRKTAMTSADANWSGRYFMNHE